MKVKTPTQPITPFGNIDSTAASEMIEKIVTNVTADQFCALVESAMQQYARLTTMPTDDTERAFNYLNAKMAAIRKTITAFDALKIQGTIDDVETANAVITSLDNNASLIVNINSFNYGNIVCRRGDIINKDTTGELHFIKSETSGFFFPSNITNIGETNNIEVTFTYTENPPVIDESTGPSTVPARNMSFDIEQYSEENSYIYGLFGLLADATDAIEYKTFTKDGITYTVEPIVYYYLKDANGNFERIMFDYDYQPVGLTEFKLYQFNSTHPNPAPNDLYYVVK